MRIYVLAFAFLGVCSAAAAAGKTEIGDLNGAAFRIDVPEKWNGNLVLYCHGYSSTAVKFKQEKPSDGEQVFLDAGYAVAMSGYSTGGWAVREGELDSLALKQYFAAKYGTPKQVYVTGHSMGGLLTVMLAERHPTDFVGAMPMCGVIAPTLETLRGAYDSLAVFHFFLPGALPAPNSIPADYQPSDELTDRVTAKLEANPRALETMERYLGLKSAKDIGGAMAFVTYLYKEAIERSGGNPVDNRSTIYVHTGDDNTVNAKIERYAADAKSVEYFRAYYTPTYRIERPMLAVHTTYDELVSPVIPNSYAARATVAGSGDLFMQQFVPNDGHCHITPAETATAFSELREWVDSGKRPNAGRVPTP